MSDKFKDNELDETKASKNDDVKFEENDSWEFEATAHTLENTEVESDEIEVTFADKIKSENDEVVDKAPVVKKAPSSKKSKGKGNAAKFICAAVISIAVIALLTVFGVRYYTVPNTSEKMNPGNVALTVGDEKVSIGMYNYYYNTISQNYISYAQQGYYNLDATKDFSKQTTTDENGKEITWSKLFVNDTVDRLQYILALYQSGVEKGVTLTETQKETIKTNLDSLKESASDSEISVDEYISETYGEYCGYATIEKMLTQAYIANNYYRQYLIENRPTEEETNAYYEKHKDNYAEVSFAYVPITYNPEDASALAKAQKDAEKYAKGVKSVKDLKKIIPIACKDLIEQYVEAGYYSDFDTCAEQIAASIETTITKSDTTFTEEGANWLFSDKTKVNSAKTFTDETNAVVFILLKTGDVSLADDEVYSVRHILITPKKAESKDDTEEQTASEDYTDEEWKEAEKTAKNILDEYNKGEKTEIQFALLAEKYSDDTESTSNGQSGLYGGLYEGVQLGNMVPEFEEWSTDKSRKYGDTDIVKSEYGYHIMYFIEDTKYYLFDSEQGAVSEKGEKFIESFEVKKHKRSMKKTTVAKPQTEQQTTEAVAE